MTRTLAALLCLALASAACTRDEAVPRDSALVRDRGALVDLPVRERSVAADRALATDKAAPLDKAAPPDKAAAPDLPPLPDFPGKPESGADLPWKQCGSVGHDNACLDVKTMSKGCCLGADWAIPSGKAICPPGLSCLHVDCLAKDGGMQVCPVGSYCRSHFGCSCTKSNGACSPCQVCVKSCGTLLKKCAWIP